MLRIADNFGDYYAYQLKLDRDKKVERANLDKLDIRLGCNADTKNSKRNDKQTNNFNEMFQEELEKYR